MAGRPNRIYRSLDKTSSSPTPFFLACHSDPPTSLSRRRSLNVYHPHTNTHTHKYSEFHPRDIFLPRHVQRAAQRSVASLCSFPSSLRRVSSVPVPCVPRVLSILFSSHLFPLCCLLLLRVCQRRSFFVFFSVTPSRLATSRAASKGGLKGLADILKIC